MTPEIVSRVAQTQAPRPLVDMRCWAKKSAKLLGAAAVVSLLASPIAFANEAANSERMTREEHACTVVMGLHRPGDLYDTCIRSLRNSLSGLDRTRLASTDETNVPAKASRPVHRVMQSAW